MYKLLLCLRYLHTRYLAFLCIISVMLGVATLIVVNSVMSGFSTKLKDRLHGILSDVRVATDRSDGFEHTTPQLEAKIAASPVGKHVEATSPIIDTIAIMQYTVRDQFGRKIPMTQQVKLMGIDPARQSKVGGFGEYLVRHRDSPERSFELDDAAMLRYLQTRSLDLDEAFQPVPPPKPVMVAGNNPGAFLEPPPLDIPPIPIPGAEIPAPNLGPPPAPRMPGIILGHALAHWFDKNRNEERPLLLPGDEVFIATVGASGSKPVTATFLVSDFLKTGMTEYDSNLVYVPLEDLQRIRGMEDRVNGVQVKLKPDVRGDSRFVHEVFVPELQKTMPMPEARVQSWEQQQGPLLAAIDIERSILNVLLFLIVGVAGFGVLAIFSMIVSEKVRDIGILKALGASSQGVMAIFLGYGVLLGVVGCGLGTALGLWFTWNINAIEAGLSRASGTKVFDRSTYYFDQIPTNVETSSVALVNLGALGIAVAFSVLPALRAARLQPVRALRFE